MFGKTLAIIVPVVLAVLVVTLSNSQAGTAGSATTTGGLGEGEIPVSWKYSTVVPHSSLSLISTAGPTVFEQTISAPPTHGIYFLSIEPQRLIGQSRVVFTVHVNGDYVRQVHYESNASNVPLSLYEGIRSPFLIRPGETATFRFELTGCCYNTYLPSDPFYQTSLAFIPASKLPAVPNF